MKKYRISFSYRNTTNILILFFIIQLSNCAIFQRKNLILVNAVEENLVPIDSSAKIWASPFYIPVGILAGALDVFLVHPISVIPNAAEETIDLLWSNNEDLGYVTRMGIIPFSAILTAPMFTISWTYYWLFEGSEEKTQDPLKKKYTTNEWMAELDTAFKENSSDQIGKLLKSCGSRKRSSMEIYLLIDVYERYKNNIRVYHSMSSIHCLIWNAGYNSDLEDFVVKIFLKDHSIPMIYENRENLVYYFIHYKSQKGSKALLQMLSDDSLDIKWIPFIVNKLFEFGFQEDRDEIINRIQRKKFSI